MRKEVYLILLILLLILNFVIRWIEVRRIKKQKSKQLSIGNIFTLLSALMLPFYFYYASIQDGNLDEFKIFSGIMVLLYFLGNGFLYQKTHEVSHTASIFYIFLYPALGGIVVLAMQGYMQVIQMVTALQIPLTLINVLEYRKNQKIEID